MGEDDEGLVKVATRQVICAGERGYGVSPPLTYRLPDLVRCEQCRDYVAPIEAIYYDGHAANAPAEIGGFQASGNSAFLMPVNPRPVRVTARTAPHYRTERLQLRWVYENEDRGGMDEDRFEAAPIPEGPEWEFTDG
jgi:hypothetical protein